MTAFHHVAISSADAEKSIRFYEQLGFRVVFRGAALQGGLTIIHMKLGDALLEIFNCADPAPAPETAASLDSDLRRIGVKHFGLKVADIEKALVEIKERGLAHDPKINEGRTGLKYIFINDPDGNWVEIVQDDRGL